MYGKEEKIIMKNTGVEYEKLTQNIFNQIINQDTVKTINVQHDVVLKGKTTTHQIDVYWEFDLNGIKYRTVIQAKDWKNKVPQKEMYAFKAILDDLPSGTKGIYVCKSGFQEGAVSVAQSNDIKIYVLRDPIDADWDGKIKTIVINFKIRMPTYKNMNALFDANWLKENVADFNKYIGRNVFNGNSEILDHNNNRICLLSELVLQMADKSKDGVEYQEHIFEQDAFLKIDDGICAKIISISGDVGYSVTHEEMTIDGGNTIGYILKDLLEDKTFTFDKEEKLI